MQELHGCCICHLLGPTPTYKLKKWFPCDKPIDTMRISSLHATIGHGPCHFVDSGIPCQFCNLWHCPGQSIFGVLVEEMLAHHKLSPKSSYTCSDKWLALNLLCPRNLLWVELQTKELADCSARKAPCQQLGYLLVLQPLQVPPVICTCICACTCTCTFTSWWRSGLGSDLGRWLGRAGRQSGWGSKVSIKSLRECSA